jgi:hypothetical protein
MRQQARSTHAYPWLDVSAGAKKCFGILIPLLSNWDKANELMGSVPDMDVGLYM